MSLTFKIWISIVTLMSLHGISSSAESKPAATQEISLCAEPDFPPFMWFSRDENGKKSATQVEGYTIEVMKEAFGRMNIKVRFEMSYPWNRCMEMVKLGEVDFGMDAYFDKDRAKFFKYSKPYRKLTPQVFFLKETTDFKITKKDDLKKYKGCGLLGYSYDHYGLSSKELDSGAKSYNSAIEKLKAKRCVYFPEEYEVLTGFKILNKDYLSEGDILSLPVPGVDAPKLHLIAGLKNHKALKLIEKINQQIQKLEKSGELDKIYKVQMQKTFKNQESP